MKSIIACVLFVFAFISCSRDEKIRTKILESEGVKIEVRAFLSKDFDAGVAGGGHTGLIIPYFSRTKELGLMINPERRQGYRTFTHSAGTFKTIKEKELDELISDLSVVFSPNKKHLLYINNAANYKDTILIHYLEDKYPFSSRYTKNIFNSGTMPDWTRVPDPVEIAIEIMNDTSSDIVSYDLWWIFDSLKPENKLDYTALSLISKNEYVIARLYNINSSWKERSKKWKKTFRDYFSSFTTQYVIKGQSTESGDTYPTIRDMALKTGDKEMRSMYSKAVISVFSYTQLLDIGATDTAESFFRANREVLTVRCYEELKKNSPEKIAYILNLNSYFNNKDLQQKTLARLADMWPDIPDGKVGYGTLIDDYYSDLSEKQKKQLIERAKRLVETDSTGNYEAFNFLGKHLPCNEVRALAKKYPGKIDPNNFECVTHTDEKGNVSYSDRKAD